VTDKIIETRKNNENILPHDSITGYTVMSTLSTVLNIDSLCVQAHQAVESEVKNISSTVYNGELCNNA